MYMITRTIIPDSSFFVNLTNLTTDIKYNKLHRSTRFLDRGDIIKKLKIIFRSGNNRKLTFKKFNQVGIQGMAINFCKVNEV